MSVVLRRGAGVLTLLACLVLALALLLAQERGGAERTLALARAQARLTRGGLGLGSSLGLEWSARHLDPRLERASGCDAFPFPGGPGFCPDQTTGLFAPPDDPTGLPRLRRARQDEAGGSPPAQASPGFRSSSSGTSPTP